MMTVPREIVLEAYACENDDGDYDEDDDEYAGVDAENDNKNVNGSPEAAWKRWGLSHVRLYNRLSPAMEDSSLAMENSSPAMENSSPAMENSSPAMENSSPHQSLPLPKRTTRTDVEAAVHAANRTANVSAISINGGVILKIDSGSSKSLRSRQRECKLSGGCNQWLGIATWSLVLALIQFQFDKVAADSGVEPEDFYTISTLAFRESLWTYGATVNICRSIAFMLPTNLYVDSWAPEFGLTAVLLLVLTERPFTSYVVLLVAMIALNVCIAASCIGFLVTSVYGPGTQLDPPTSAFGDTGIPPEEISSLESSLELL
ncbi:predicted protein [Phaeodactylum tricornutum CCAP 1055/1]|uniref:Transmembrane protein n=1 Tax=Phaeodactylum tricornutum (strain CCAP 1055/1) TaxID=556484 RepID=B7FZK7_PHATC|nr:predicted protein [Phaeodactylum tricornutum CCAP 1055/1]EEC48355.1 predicted protein [Phaeodactylum tricornutum CCAP 1055/1]|eukprot:XP_002180164.1 predicted protein [Phaeodactylum tricornutum CCAP 1055/1]